MKSNSEIEFWNRIQLPMIDSNSRSNSNLNDFKYDFECVNEEMIVSRILFWPANTITLHLSLHPRKLVLSYIEPKLIIIILHLRLSDPVF